MCPPPGVKIQAISECNAQGTTWLFFPSELIQQSASSSLPTQRCEALTALGTPQLSASFLRACPGTWCHQYSDGDLLVDQRGESGWKHCPGCSQMWFPPLNPKCSFVKSEAFCLFSTGCTRFLPSCLQQRQGVELEGKVFYSNSCALKHWNKLMSVVSWTVCVWHVLSERAQLCASELGRRTLFMSGHMQLTNGADIWGIGPVVPHTAEQTAWLCPECLLCCWGWWWRCPLWQQSFWSASLWVRNRTGQSLLSNRVWSTSLDWHNSSQSHLALAEFRWTPAALSAPRLRVF